MLKSPPGILRGVPSENAIVWFLYRLMWPLTLLCFRFGLHQNFITALGVGLAFLAALSLVGWGAYIAFVILWTASVLLDFVDGPLARLRNQPNRTAFHLDHYADLLRVVVGIFAIAAFYNNITIWISSYIAVTSLLLFTVLNHDLKRNATPHKPLMVRQRRTGAVLPKVRTIASPLYTLHAGTLLLLAGASLSRLLAISILAYITAVCLLMSWRTVHRLKDIPRNA